MNPYANVPPGCHPDDTGTSDTYECVVCGSGFEQGELDPDQDEPTCRECAAVDREQQREKEAEERVRQAAPALLEACRAFEKAICAPNGPIEQQRLLQEAWWVASKAIAAATQGGDQ